MHFSLLSVGSVHQAQVQDKMSVHVSNSDKTETVAGKLIWVVIHRLWLLLWSRQLADCIYYDDVTTQALWRIDTKKVDNFKHEICIFPFVSVFFENRGHDVQSRNICWQKKCN